MTEALLNNILQAGSSNFSQAKRKQSPNNSDKSFSETIQEINHQRQQTQRNSKKGSAAIKEQTSKMDNQEFLKKLKEILAKNNKEVPSELLSLLQGGSLSKQQEAMLGQLMLNLENNNLDISELKSLLEKNSNDLSAENSELLQLLAGDQDNQKSEIQSLDADDLEEIAARLEAGELNLSEKDSSELKKEIDRLAKALLTLKSDDKKSKQSLEQITGTEKIDNKLTELISALKESDFQAEDLAALTEQEEVKTPLLGKLLNSDNPDFAEFSQTLNSENADSLF
ncbi:MAG: hypothetical protein ABR547_02255, partial [Halanaerobium sp.]